MKRLLFVCSFVLLAFTGMAQHILIPMDNTQSNHLKAYGIMYLVLENGGTGTGCSTSVGVVLPFHTAARWRRNASSAMCATRWCPTPR